MKYFLLLGLIFPCSVFADKQADTQQINRICSELKTGASWIVKQYFNGVTLEQQYIMINQIIPIDTAPVENEIYKGLTDTVYRNFPYVQNIDQRNWYEDQFSEGIYKMCIDKYATLKP